MTDDGICWDAGNTFDGALTPAERDWLARANPSMGFPVSRYGVAEPVWAVPAVRQRRRWWHRFRRDVDAT